MEEKLAELFVDFDLRVGLTVGDGRVVPRGRMRAARVRDELEVLRDYRVFMDPESMTPLLLARCVEFDGVGQVRPSMLESLALPDLFLLENLYRELNGYPRVVARECHETVN
jgi:hypothetical protein